MKAELTPYQQDLINKLTNELKGINVTYEKKSGKKNPFDFNDLVGDIADKQKALDEAKVIKKTWTDAMYKQLNLDVKKLFKVMDKIGFIVENYETREKRVLPHNRLNSIMPYLYFSHKYNRDSGVNRTTHEANFHFEYVLRPVKGRRADVDNIGFFDIIIYGSGYSGEAQRVKTIEDAMETEKVKEWIKSQYEKATLKK